MLGNGLNRFGGVSLASSSSSHTTPPTFVVTPPNPIPFDAELYFEPVPWPDQLPGAAATSFLNPHPLPSPSISSSNDTNANTNANIGDASAPNPPLAARLPKRTRKRNHDISPPQAFSFRQSGGAGLPPGGCSSSSRSDTGGTVIINGSGNGNGSRRPGAMSTHSSQAQSISHDDSNGSRSRIAANAFFPDIPKILPHEKVFPIQIGGELFRLSGASISSDAPSYFSQFFQQQLENLEEGQNVRTLYIDRDPVTFRDIARHLQGYHVSPKDGQHYVRLFADAQFYSLPKLISQLFESEIFISIGGTHFQINRDVFNSPGNSPNYFSLGFAVFFSSPNEVFPGLSREGLLRPPSILPPEVPNCSAENFSEILRLLRGYPVHLRNEEHRRELLRDCRYFNFKGLEQKLIPHDISWNEKRQRNEIVIRLEDIKPSGIAFSPEGSALTDSPFPVKPASGWINYSRPFVDDVQRELIVEIGGERTRVDWRNGRAEFTGIVNRRMASFFQCIANKLGLPVGHERALGLVMMAQSGGGGGIAGGAAGSPMSPGDTPLSEDRVKISIGPDCHVRLDGEEYWDHEGLQAHESYDNRLDAESAFGPAGSEAGRGTPSPGLGWQGVRAASGGGFLGVGQAGSRKRQKRKASGDEGGEWIVKRGQWRVRVQTTQGIDGRAGYEVILVAVKFDALSSEHGRNLQRNFLI